MFDFIKKFFKTEEEKKPETVARKDLARWFEDKSAPMLENVHSDIKQLSDDIGGNVAKTKEHLEKLEKAQLKNKNIPPKEMQIMEGNRKGYITAIGIFLHGLRVPTELDAVLEFSKKLDIKLDQLSKSTNRNFHVLQHFFANESRNVAIEIKKIENRVKDFLKKLENENINTINGTKADISVLLDKQKAGKQLAEEKKMLQEDIENLEREGKEAFDSIEKIKASKAYKELASLKERLADEQKKYESISTTLKNYFLTIEHPLKKFGKVTLEEALLQSYLLDPAKALIGDEKLGIISIFESFLRNVNEGKLNIKDRQRQKVLETADKMTADFFASTRKQLIDVNTNIRAFDSEIKYNTVETEISDIEKKVKLLGEQAKSKEKSLKHLKIEQKNLDTVTLLEKIRKGIEKALNIELKINT